MDKNDEAQQEVETLVTEVETLEEAPAEEQDTTDWKAKFEEVSGRLKRAETKLEKGKIDKKVEAKLAEKTEELDETQLDYLDLKGISEDEDIKIIERHVQRTGETVRQALKDEYVQSKLTANKEKRDVSAATPSATKRSNAGQASDLARAIAKFEQSGELPNDFELKSKVVNALADRSNGNKPAWH